jgi:hypothetical protein
MRIGLAFRAFFRVLSDNTLADRVSAVLASPDASAPALPGKEQAPALPAPARAPSKPAAPARSDAITLLAALQREARFVDIVKEPLDQYTDAKIGAAARDVLKDCGRVLERLFAIRPLVDQPEGSEIEAPAGYDAGRYRLTGNVHAEPPFKGSVVHPGWQATRTDLPQWSGSAASAGVVAPIEIEMR